MKGGHCDVSKDISCNGEDGQCPEGETCKAPGGCKKDMKMTCKTDEDCGESGPCVEATSSPVEGEGDDDNDDDDEDGDKDQNDEDSGKDDDKDNNDDDDDDKGDDGNKKDSGDRTGNKGKNGKNDNGNGASPPELPASGKKGGLDDLLNGKKKGGLGAALFMNLVEAAQASMGRRRRFRESDVNLRSFQPNIPDANANPLEFKKSPFVEESRPSMTVDKTRLKPSKQSIAGSSNSLFSASTKISAMSNPLYSMVGAAKKQHYTTTTSDGDDGNVGVKKQHF